jgi:hypothetical protein
MNAQTAAIVHQPLTGPAGELAQTIAAAQTITDLKPVKDVIRASDKFTAVEKTLLLTLATAREDDIAQTYTYTQLRRDADRKRGSY